MVTSLAGAQYAQAVTTFGYEGTKKRASHTTPQGDVVAISDTAYAALDAHRKRMTQGDPLHPPLLPEQKTPKEAPTAEESLMDKLWSYLRNPALANALEKMGQTISGMGYDETTAATILDQVKIAFRSGIPAKGQQTTDAMKNLQKNLRDTTGLTDDQLSEMMEKISTIIAEVQEEDPKTTPADAGSQSLPREREA